MTINNLSDNVPSSSMQQQGISMSSGPQPIGSSGYPPRYSDLEREHSAVANMGYGTPSGPPPSSYSYSYPHHHHHHPYGTTPLGIYGSAPPPPGPPPGYPVGAYPPHPSSYGPAYSGGPGPGYPPSVHPPPYSFRGGYESHYGGQPPGPPSNPQALSTYRGSSPIPPPSSTTGPSCSMRPPDNDIPSTMAPSDQHSLVSAGSSIHRSIKCSSSPPELKTTTNTTAVGGDIGGTKRSSPRQSPDSTTQQQHHHQQQLHDLPDHVEVERLRAAAATEITTEEVKPIQTDFHFFVKKNIEKYLKLAEEEVRNSTKNESNGDDDKNRKLDPFLVNSNLNTRLMKVWEAVPKESRDAFMVKEEDDRRRFMEEDEIASRHCATLTARGKSPRVVDNKGQQSKQQQQQQGKIQSVVSESKFQPQKGNELKTVVKKEMDDEGKKIEEQSVTKSDPSKRPVPISIYDNDTPNETQESPTKRKKMGIRLVRATKTAH